ncbi:hypothetical protein BAE44_0000980, partial [Dichanthelium oligosanthes]
LPPPLAPSHTCRAPRRPTPWRVPRNQGTRRPWQTRPGGEWASPSRRPCGGSSTPTQPPGPACWP